MQLKSIGVIQTAKIMAAMYFIISAVVVVPMVFFGAIFGHQAHHLRGLLFIFAPLLYAIIGFVFVAIFAWVYNHVAQWLGGIEFDLS